MAPKLGFLAQEGSNGHPYVLHKKAKDGPGILALCCLLLHRRPEMLIQKPIRCQTQFFTHQFAFNIAQITFFFFLSHLEPN